VRFSYNTNQGKRLWALLGSTEGPYALNPEVNYAHVASVFKGPEGRVYAYGSSTDGCRLVVRLR
jgi:hypothetical protein